MLGNRAQGEPRRPVRTDFPDRNDDEWLKHINVGANGGEEPEISYSEVTMTQWEPHERTY